MKKIIALALPLAACVLFTSPSFADKSDVLRELAEIAKKNYEKKFGDFPIEVDDKMSLRNIISSDESIIHDYRYKGSIDEFLQKDVDIYADIFFDKKLCKNEQFVSSFENYLVDLDLLYTFNDKTSVSTFNINGLCEYLYSDD